MREKARIKRICKLIEKLWLKNENHRLGQLLANYVFGHHTDIFFQEDDISEACLKKQLNETL